MSEVALSWRTETAVSARVRYGQRDVPESSWGVRVGESVESAGGFNHHVRLAGLEPGRRYSYRVSGPNGVWGPVCGFMTAPENSESSFTFAVVGDVQGKEEPSGLWQEAGRFLASMEDLAFVLLLGDQVDTGFSQTQWDAFFNSLEQSLDRSLFHSTVIMPLLGNHDYYGGEGNSQGVELYLDQFRLPPNKQGKWEGRYYTFNYQDAMFVVLDSLGCNKGKDDYFATQTRWLKTLDWGSRKWCFVAHHQGAYPFRNHSPSFMARDVWRPHFYDKYASVVFSGHNHSLAASAPLRAVRLDGLEGGHGFAGPWRAKEDRGCPSTLSNMLLLEDNDLISYPGYNSAGRSISTFTAGSMDKRAMQASRKINPVKVSPGDELWIGYLYQKKDGWYADGQGGWRLAAENDAQRFLQLATARVEKDKARHGHFSISLGEKTAVAHPPVAPEGRKDIPEAPFFVLAKFIFAENSVTGKLKSYRAPAALPSKEPQEWDAIVHLDEPWNLNLDTLTLLGEDERRFSLMDELRVGKSLKDVLLIPSDGSIQRKPLVEERFNAVPTLNSGDGVIHYDGGGVNSNTNPGDYWYIRFGQQKPRMPLLTLVTVSPESTTVKTVFFAKFDSFSPGDVLDKFNSRK